MSKHNVDDALKKINTTSKKRKKKNNGDYVPQEKPQHTKQKEHFQT